MCGRALPSPQCLGGLGAIEPRVWGDGHCRALSLPNALLVLFSVFKDGFLQPHSPSKKASCWWRPSTALLVSVTLPSKPRAGALVSSGCSHLAFTEGKEEFELRRAFYLQFFSAYLTRIQCFLRGVSQCQVKILAALERFSNASPSAQENIGFEEWRDLQKYAVEGPQDALCSQSDTYVVITHSPEPSRPRIFHEPSALSSCAGSQYSSIQRGVQLWRICNHR